MFQNDLYTICVNTLIFNKEFPSLYTASLYIGYNGFLLHWLFAILVVKAPCYIQFLSSATKIVFNILINIADIYQSFNTAKLQNFIIS